MALTDPQSVTIGATPHSLPRVSSGQNSSDYQSNDGNVRLAISHQNGKRFRRTVRLTHRKIAQDPLLAQNVEYSMSTYVVMDIPRVGYSVAQAKEVVDALVAYLAASTGASVTKILGAES